MLKILVRLEVKLLFTKKFKVLSYFPLQILKTYNFSLTQKFEKLINTFLWFVLFLSGVDLPTLVIDYPPFFLSLTPVTLSSLSCHLRFSNEDLLSLSEFIFILVESGRRGKGELPDGEIR